MKFGLLLIVYNMYGGQNMFLTANVAPMHMLDMGYAHF